VDDHRVFAEAVSARLALEDDLGPVIAVVKADEVVATAERFRPSVVLMDVTLDRWDGLELTRELRELDHPPAVIVVTADDNADTAVTAVRAGALGFVSKASGFPELVTAVRAARRGESSLPAALLGEVLRRLQDAPPSPAPDHPRALAALSSRELEVLELLVSGLDRSAIATRLYRSPNTVRTHTRNILSKLGAHSMVEAVAIGLRAGLRPGPAERHMTPVLAGLGAGSR
jgi:DNA-binding NarL/FixJ family response regulator